MQNVEEFDDEEEFENPEDVELGPGVDAINYRLESIYGIQEPQHWGTLMRYVEGGPDPLDGVSAYESADRTHWHYVSYGLSELDEKSSPNEAESGWGFEFSFRVKREEDDENAPVWPIMLLQELARYVFNSKMAFEDRHYIQWGGPITDEFPTRLTALVFMTDPELGVIETPHGSLAFLTPIGVTDEEYLTAETADDAEAVFPSILRGNPLGITDILRH